MAYNILSSPPAPLSLSLSLSFSLSLPLSLSLSLSLFPSLFFSLPPISGLFTNDPTLGELLLVGGGGGIVAGYG